VETERETVLYIKHFMTSQKCPYNVTFDLDLGRDPAICLQEEAIFVKLRNCPYHVTFDLNLDLEHTLDAGPSGDHRVQVWWRSSHVCGRRAILVQAEKCPYHVTFDLDLEHILDAGPPGDHRVPVWWP